MTEHQKALRHLRRDPVIARLIKKHQLAPLKRNKDLFAALCREIIGQQLSGRVSEVILGRFKAFFKNRTLTPQAILKLSDQKIRSCGCSWAKVKYLKSLSQCVLERKLRLDKLEELPDAEVRRELLLVKGIGPWTAEMFLIFTLGRPDIFSVGDLGLRSAVAKLYKVARHEEKKIAAIAAQWSPYRSTACRYLWASVDGD